MKKKSFDNELKYNIVDFLPSINKEKRKAVLKECGYNTEFIPAAFKVVDLGTDSGNSAIFQNQFKYYLESTPPEESLTLNDELEGKLKELTGKKNILFATQGRTAEFIFSNSFIKKGDIVLTGSLFPTTRIHLEKAGAKLLDVSIDKAYDLSGDFKFKGNLDLEKIDKYLKKYKKIKCIYVEACANAIGGHPISIKNLEAIRKISLHYNIKTAIDASRILENCILIKDREAKYKNASIKDIFKKTCFLSDFVIMSLQKDFPVGGGGLIAFSDKSLYFEMLRTSILCGSAMDLYDRQLLARALYFITDNDSYIYHRFRQVKILWKNFYDKSIPVLQPYCAHAVYVDVNKMFPRIKKKYCPSQAFLSYLYYISGVGASDNFYSPQQRKRKFSIVRFAVPRMRYSEKCLQTVSFAVKECLNNRNKIKGLKPARPVKEEFDILFSTFRLCGNEKG